MSDSGVPPRISFSVHRPRAELADYVGLIWFVRATADCTREKVLPNGVVELIVNLGPYLKEVDPADFSRFQVYKEAWIAGLQEDVLIIEAFDYADLVGIRLTPCGITPFLRDSPALLTNTVVACSNIFGRILEPFQDHHG
ncbi:MAG: DUF6597 domain-containing transcriptional factor [Chloroflexota bacterium]